MSKGKVLVIDDEEIVRTSCIRVLSPEGYQVNVAENGMKGMKMIEEENFDVVLTDLKMPDMDGIEILKKIKKEWPSIEVIIITGYQAIDAAKKSINLGAFEYIEKPFTPDVVLQAVLKAMEYKKNS